MVEPDERSQRSERAGPVDGLASGVRPVDLRDYADFRRGEATHIRVFATDQLALDLWCLQPHTSTPVLHDPRRDVAYTVIGGRGWFVTDEGEVGLDPMGSLLVPCDTVHGIDNRLPDPLIVLASVAPPGAPPGDTPTDPVSNEAQALGTAVRTDPRRQGTLRRLLGRLSGGSAA